MKRIKALTEAERLTLREAFRYAPSSRFRQRAHAVYLSDKGYRLAALADIFAVDRDTVSGWLTAWETEGLMGLYDRPHPGRPPRCSETDWTALEEALEQAPHQAKRLPAQFEALTGRRLSLSSLRRGLRERHWVWKRCRRSVKAQRDPAAFAEGQRVLCAFEAKAAAGEIDLYYLDESGFCASSYVPYAWQRRGETRSLPANAPGRVNVIGFMNRQGQGYFHPVEGCVNADGVAEAMAGFVAARPAERLTVVVADNASVHRKAVRKHQEAWLLHRVWVWFLPPYSPELNRIEVLWKKIKAEWLTWEAYFSFDALQAALQDIFQGFGEKYRINFA